MKKINALHVATPQGESGHFTHDARYVFNYTTKERTCETSLLMPLRKVGVSSNIHTFR